MMLRSIVRNDAVAVIKVFVLEGVQYFIARALDLNLTSIVVAK